MEHLVQFMIGIDDDAIKKRITESAEKQIVEGLKAKYESEIEHQIFKFDRDRWNGNKEFKVGLQPWVEDLVVKLLDKHQDEIIERAADRLADKLSRTKAIKEAMAAKVAGETEEE